ADPLEIVPAHGGGLGVAQTADVNALEHGAALEAGLEVGAVMAGVTVARVVRPQPGQGFLVASAAAVDRHRDRGAAGSLGALGDGLRDLKLVGGVKLQPDRRATRLDHVLDPAGGHSGHDLEMVAGLRSAGGGKLAVIVEGALAADRR